LSWLEPECGAMHDAGSWSIGRLAPASPSDVQRVFGRAAAGVVPASSAVRTAQDRGALLPARGRVARAIDRIALGLLEEAS
jgi:hypothetical protein